MLLTNQQKMILEILKDLGGAKLDQIAALLRPIFCLEKPDIAARLTATAIRQLRLSNEQICQEGDLVYLPGRKPQYLLIEAVDTMLELSSGKLISFRHGKLPIILHFSIQDSRASGFAVMATGSDISDLDIPSSDRIILLFDGQHAKRPLPVSNKQFCAVRQENGMHRFYALDRHT